MDSKQKKCISGKVTSNKMKKTVTVTVDRIVKHPIYGKYVRRITKLHVHDEHNLCKQGDLVTIRQCRPLSKTKSWVLVDITKNA